MNEEEAKKTLKTMKENIDKKYLKSRNSVAIETVLNLIQTQQAEIEKKDKQLKKKDKIIDEMAKCIDIELSSSRLGIILNKNVKPLESYKKHIKQYFEMKSEKGN